MAGAATLLVVAASLSGQEAGPGSPGEAAAGRDTAVADRSSGRPAATGTAAAPGLSPQGSAAGVAAPSSTGRALLRRSDIPYAVAFFGSLALVEPLQGVDRRIHAVADGNGSGPDHLFHAAGAWAGNLWIDVGAAAATFGIGELAGSSRVARLGLRSLESLVAVDLLATLFKVGVGRERPETADDPDVFRPVAWSHEFASFPSGHAAHAFALAATVSRELGGWAPWVAYPLAAGVGASRVIGGRHWPTDIVAGASLGLFTARLVGRLHAPHDPSPAGTLIVLPGPGPALLLGATLPTR